MKIYHNFLPEDLIEEILVDIETQKSKYHSRMFWPYNLYKEIKGVTHVKKVSEPVTNRLKLIVDSKKCLPSYNSFEPAYYIWDYNSGINWHDDGIYAWGGTIYLNRDWDASWGGIFQYQHEDNVVDLVPTFNSFVVNEDHTRHRVTPITSKAQEFRTTIQIFCQ